MPSKEHQPEHQEPERSAYSRAARFAGERPAGQAYFAVQRLIFTTDSDLSCYRLQLDRIWHVAVLGEEPPARLAARLEAALAQGDLTSLPDEVMRVLQARRNATIRSGAHWTERHYRGRPDPSA